jgi:hypothetical protein
MKKNILLFFSFFNSIFSFQVARKILQNRNFKHEEVYRNLYEETKKERDNYQKRLAFFNFFALTNGGFFFANEYKQKQLLNKKESLKTEIPKKNNKNQNHDKNLYNDTNLYSLKNIFFTSLAILSMYSIKKYYDYYKKNKELRNKRMKIRV